ncbi:MAG: hypothetical protein JXR48_00210, partial [Candidatus Delongbacteria bacterium]|nr:hypothetical protein [Candidatus Delongbacteria bacterium]
MFKFILTMLVTIAVMIIIISCGKGVVSVDENSPTLEIIAIESVTYGDSIPVSFSIVDDEDEIDYIEISLALESISYDEKIVNTISEEPWECKLATADLTIDPYIVSAEAFDNSGNSYVSSFSVDIIDKTIPVITILEPDVLSQINIGEPVTVKAEVTDNDTVNHVEFALSGNTENAILLNGVWTATLPTTGLNVGVSAITANATDASSNSAVVKSVLINMVDAEAPTFNLAVSDSVEKGQNLSVNITDVIDNDNINRCEIYLDDNSTPWYTTTNLPSNGTPSSATLTVGIHNIKVIAYDDQTKNSTEKNETFLVVDHTAPIVNPISSYNSINKGTPLAVSVTGYDIDGIQKVELYVNNVLKQTLTTSPYSINLETAEYAVGSVPVLKAVVYDKSGNNTSVTKGITIVDTEKPVTTIIEPSAGTDVNIGQSVTVKAMVTDNNTVTGVIFNLNGNNYNAVNINNVWMTSLPTTGLTVGVKTITVNAVDANTNQAVAKTVSIDIVDSESPTFDLTMAASVEKGSNLSVTVDNIVD